MKGLKEIKFAENGADSIPEKFCDGAHFRDTLRDTLLV
jgi:hypothetical protein